MVVSFQSACLDHLYVMVKSGYIAYRKATQQDKTYPLPCL
jgi:hypothetical protein